MQALLGFLSIFCVLALIMSRRMIPMAALIIIPIAFAIIGGAGFNVGSYAVNGIKSLAPIIGMIVFAMLFFGVIKDAGTLDPIIDGILKIVGIKPTRILVGTAILATIVMLDGSGAITFLVTIPAMLPLYDRLKISRHKLACVVALAAGSANMLPWGGPTIRAATSLQLNISDVYLPVIPVQIVGLLFVYAFSWWLGLSDNRRLKAEGIDISVNSSGILGDAKNPHSTALNIKQTRLKFWCNITLAIAVLTVMLANFVAPVICFMVGTLLALFLNFKTIDEQKSAVARQADSCMLMVTMLLAAGVFVGIMKDSGMLSAMAQYIASHVPESGANHIPFILAIFAMPLSLVFDPDSFYFGILPVLTEAGAVYGVPPVQIAQAAIMGQMTVGFPISPLTPATFLLVGLCKIDLGTHQRYCFFPMWATSIIMTLTAVLLGIFPI